MTWFRSITRWPRFVIGSVRGFWGLGPTLAKRLKRWRSLRSISRAYGPQSCKLIAMAAGRMAAVNGEPIEACWRLTDEVARMAADGATLDEVTDWLADVDELWLLIDAHTPRREAHPTCPVSPN